MAIVVGRAVALGICAGLLLAAPTRGRCEDAGMRAYVDPTTGALTTTPPPDATPTPQAAVAPAPADEVRVPAPGGGMMVDTRGRLDQAMTATVGADGELHTGCGTAAASGR